MTDEEMADKFYFDVLNKDGFVHDYQDVKQAYLAGLKAGRQNEKVKYTLKKIIETVHNDRIDEYGARLVLIKDFAYECLQEIEK